MSIRLGVSVQNTNIANTMFRTDCDVTNDKN